MLFRSEKNKGKARSNCSGLFSFFPSGRIRAMALEIRIKKVEKDAKIPDQPYEGDAGFDLYAQEKVKLEPMERIGVRTGIAMAIPEGYVGLVWDKSGVSIKGGLKTLAGVIDYG